MSAEMPYLEPPSEETVGAALAWITSELEAAGLEYQIVGGLAARAYGSIRPLIDIDLYSTLGPGANAFLSAGKPRTTWGPSAYADEAWRLTYMKLDFDGQTIEVGDTDSDPRFWDTTESHWRQQHINYEASERISIYGVTVNVMRFEDLVDYKRRLGRAVDLEDIAQIT